MFNTYIYINMTEIAKKDSRYETFKKKHGDELIKKRITCDICCGSYTYFNKSTHKKSKKHTALLKMQNEISELKNKNNLN